MPATQRFRFVETFEAPPATVCAAMIGPQSYREWTAAFCEGSYFDGSWDEGQRIRFLSPSGDGVVAEIAEHRPNDFISVRHLGVVSNGTEDTDSDAVRAWAPAYENYRFEALPDGGTRLTVEQDVTPDIEGFMRETWPKALARLKAITQRDAAAKPEGSTR